MGEDKIDVESLWLPGNPDDHPAWREAERRFRDRECGISYFPEGWLTCPAWWVVAVGQTVKGANQAIAAMALYGLIRTDRFVPVPNRYFTPFGISRRTKYRMLALLEEVGLIEIERINRCTLRARLVLPARDG
jgi:hypothetical protein